MHGIEKRGGKKEMTKTNELESKLAEHRNRLLKTVHRVADCLALPIEMRKCGLCADKSVCHRISGAMW